MWLYAVCFLSFLVQSQCANSSSDCLQKEKTLGVLDIAKESIDKAKHLFPNCSDDHATNSSGCGKKEKALALLQIATDMISEAENNYPNCSDAKPPVLQNPKPMDCAEILLQGNTTSGVYQIWPRSRLVNSSISVYCDMETDGGGWTVIQRRGNFSVVQNFNQDWENYKKGFGDLKGEFWLGNDNISALTNQGNYSLRFDLADFEGIRKYAVYKNFWIENEEAKYKLHVWGYSGDAGNSLDYENGNLFGTKDKRSPTDTSAESCSVLRGNGWWFSDCNKVNVNGLPRKDSKPTDPMNLYWKDWKSYNSLASADMKLRRL